MNMWNKYPEIQKEMGLLEDYISKSTASRNRLLSDIVSELVHAGGKRLRPAFVIASAKFGKYSGKKILPIAGAFEILHTATLVHDDVIDRSKLRRGKVTVSEKYGTEMAIYTGDFLFTKAVLMLSGGIPVDKLEVVAKAIKTICEGEVDQYQERYNIDTSVMSYLKRISRKTAVLFSAACGLGAYLGKCSPAVVRRLTKFGFYYGMAFQIRDDLNDFLYDTDKTGKTVRNDIITGHVTLPMIYALRKQPRVRMLFAAMMAKKEEISAPELQQLFHDVESCGGIMDAADMLRKYIDKGRNILGSLPANPGKDLFYELIGLLDILNYRNEK
jgi:heptaprenyl diphosphate synthase